MSKNKNTKNTTTSDMQNNRSCKDMKNDTKNGTSSKNTNTPANTYDIYTK